MHEGIQAWRGQRSTLGTFHNFWITYVEERHLLLNMKLAVLPTLVSLPALGFPASPLGLEFWEASMPAQHLCDLQKSELCSPACPEHLYSLAISPVPSNLIFNVKTWIPKYSKLRICVLHHSHNVEAVTDFQRWGRPQKENVGADGSKQEAEGAQRERGWLSKETWAYSVWRPVSRCPDRLFRPLLNDACTDNIP